MADIQTFTTPIETGSDGVIAGPWRAPRQMLADQTYDAHASLHDDATAHRLGFKAGPIEGPTHFSQFAPLGVHLFGDDFLCQGGISAHYRSPVFEREEVQAFAGPLPAGATQAPIWMLKRDGTEVLRGTIAVGQNNPPSALDARLASLTPLADPVILADVKVGLKTPPRRVRMDPDQNMGDLYPFSLNQKLAVITEPSAWYQDGQDNGSPYAPAVIPLEMISVLLQYASKDDRIPTRGPAVGLFADQEIRLIEGPLFAGHDYDITREVVALSGSRRTESLWVRTNVQHPDDDRLVATMLLNHAILKESYAAYEADRAALLPA